MTTILDQIVADKRREVAERRARTPLPMLERILSAAPPVRDFRAALEHRPGMGIIAEVKKASPSAGVLRADFDPVAIARAFESAGASAISVLTDEPRFQGRLEYLTAIRAAVRPPLLRKDFILDRYQVVEARVAGADAVLLIAEVLGEHELPALVAAVQALGMQPLVELYDRANLRRVIDSGAEMIGINNRDLRTFVTRLEHTLDLIGEIPPDHCLVSESGIRTPEDLRRLQAAGVKAVLVGETLMRSADPAAALAALRGSA
jgi:indole-3-glycerol phosphate synthase